MQEGIRPERSLKEIVQAVKPKEIRMPSKKSGTQSRAKTARGKSRSASGATSKSTKSARKGTSRKTTASGKSVKKTAKRIGAKVLAGAVAGAMKAVIPPLEEAAGASERAAGIDSRGEHAKRTARGREA
jgi:hypothetical protein